MWTVFYVLLFKREMLCGFKPRQKENGSVGQDES